MLTSLVSILVVIALALGGAGATVYAAQDSLPGDNLYGLKLDSEEFRMQLTSHEASQLALTLEFANRRVQEMKQLIEDGRPLPEGAPLQLQTRLDQALQLAAGQAEDGLTQALTQIQEHLRIQIQDMDRLQEGTGPVDAAILNRAREMVNARLSWVEEGLGNPRSFQARFNFENQPADLPGNRPETTPSNPQGPGPQDNSQPGGPNPEPGNSNGPGPSGPQTGPGPQNTPAQPGGPNPEPGGGNSAGPADPQPTPQPPSDGNPQPTPEPPGGNGPAPSSTCTPQSGAGPQPIEPPSGGSNPQPTPQPPGENGLAPSSTCTPQAGAGPQPTEPPVGENPEPNPTASCTCTPQAGPDPQPGNKGKP